MNKELWKGISLFSGIVNPHIEPDDDKKYEPEEFQSDLKQVLDEIFSVDEKSGLPKGDIQYYLSVDGNPQIKQWLELNLLQPRAVRSGSSLEGVTDDLIAEMTRSSDESFEEYVSRLDGIRNEAVENSNK